MEIPADLVHLSVPELRSILDSHDVPVDPAASKWELLADILNVNQEDEQPQKQGLVTLPPDATREIAMHLNLESIVRMCQASHRFRAFICQNNKFWLAKLAKDFPGTAVSEVGLMTSTWNCSRRR